jgi:hypothetical protein
MWPRLAELGYVTRVKTSAIDQVVADLYEHSLETAPTSGV